MIVASVRQFLNAPQRSTSIREAVRNVNMGLPPHEDHKFPLSLRKFIKAVPPGRVSTKTIPFDLLQRKFDEFVNRRDKPLFKVLLEGSKLEISFEQLPIDKVVFSEEIDIEDWRFHEVNVDRITVNVIRATPMGIGIQINIIGGKIYGTYLGASIRVYIEALYINLRLEFGQRDGAVDLLPWIDEVKAAMAKAVIRMEAGGEYVAKTTFRGQEFSARDMAEIFARRKLLKDHVAKEFISALANVNSNAPDGEVVARIRTKIFTALFEGLQKQEVRDILKQYLTPWLVGGNFHVLKVASNDRELTIEYIVPLGQLDPFPETPQAPLKQGPLANIKHIVVLMMENRSFDHMLGYLSKEGGRRDIDGLRGGEKNIYKGKTYFSSKLPDTVFEYSPCHEHNCVDNQINGGKLDGFVADYAARAEKVGIDPGLVMGYHNAAQVPVYDALAREFLICQRWFASHPGPTFPNRHYMLTGRLNRDPYGRWEYDNPESSTFVPTLAQNIFDHLTAQGVTWRYYEHGYCTLRLFERYTYDTEHIVDAGADAANFISDATAGSLPSVTFIDPDFINLPPGNDDQPPADITAGQRLVGRIADALIKSRDAWSNTLLIVTYDEHGGFFDHVPPPQAPAVSSIDRYGVRLPAFVISPWVARGQVTDIVFDHTSILKTIIRCFLHARPPDMGERVSAANDLSMVLQSTRRSDRPSIPVPAWSHRNLRLARKAEAATEGPRDFRELLRTVRSRSLVPR